MIIPYKYILHCMADYKYYDHNLVKRNILYGFLIQFYITGKRSGISVNLTTADCASENMFVYIMFSST